MLATVSSASLQGIRGRAITVEVHVTDGLPTFAVVGLPDASCREARDRVRAAVQSSGFKWPMRRVTVNLAPSGVPKTGAGLDLAIAIGVLVASLQLEAELVHGLAFIAELGLDGSLRSVPGALPLTVATGCPTAIIAPSNLAEGSLASHREVRAIATLKELVQALAGAGEWCPPAPAADRSLAPPLVDLANIRGQPAARRAAEIAAAGGHHLLLVGPPGAGKTMIAMYITLAAVAQGRQAAIMAPTEILATQHVAALQAVQD
ncbi:MAG: magnesium chelatase domain-containing protein, partial [Acidimicrobiales bacterium]